MNANLDNYHKIGKAIDYLMEHYREQPSLHDVAATVYMSPFHFQKEFVNWVGISPKTFIQYLTLTYLRKKLKDTKNMMDAADLAGLSSQSRVHDLFLKFESVSPHQYKSAGRGLALFYGCHSTPFGLCFIASSQKGICELRFIDDDQTGVALTEFSEKWLSAAISYRPDVTQKYIDTIFSTESLGEEKLKHFVQRSGYKIKVWEALLHIPFGGEARRCEPSNYFLKCQRLVRQAATTGDFDFSTVRKQAKVCCQVDLRHPICSYHTVG